MKGKEWKQNEKFKGSISNFVLSPDGLVLCALFLLSAIISWVIKNNSNEYGTSPV